MNKYISLINNTLGFKYISFFILGIFCFIIDVGVLSFLKEVIKLNIYFSISIAFFFATSINYFLNIKYVFKSGRFKKSKEIALFFMTTFVSFLITFCAMKFFLNVWFLNYLLAKVITVFFVSFFSFFTRKFIIF